MKCEKCGKFTATTHIHTVINGRVTDMHLCGYCASGKSINRLGSLGLMNILASTLNDEAVNLNSPYENELKCKKCGATFADIAGSGLVGCENCYNIFRRQLQTTLKSIHGRTHHCGKIPRSAAPRLNSTSHIESLQKQLEEAVKTENFELAATLRDEIKGFKETM